MSSRISVKGEIKESEPNALDIETYYWYIYISKKTGKSIKSFRVGDKVRITIEKVRKW
jgi:hypothetical protein